MSSNTRYSHSSHHEPSASETMQRLEDVNDEKDTSSSSPPSKKAKIEAEDSPTSANVNVNAEKDRFLHALLSLPIPRALGPDYSESDLTGHMHGWDMIPPPKGLPLEYDTFEQYIAAYLPLMMCDHWAQVRADFDAAQNTENDESQPEDVQDAPLNASFKLAVNKRGTRSNAKFVSLSLRGVVKKSDVDADRYRLTSWLVLIRPSSGGGPNVTHLLGLVLNQTMIRQPNQSLDTLPLIDGNRTSSGQYVAIEYSLKFAKSAPVFRLMGQQRELCLRPISRYSQGLRHLESLLNAGNKQDIARLLLKPDPDLFRLNTSPPDGFECYDEETYNTYQKEAIVASYNAVYEGPDRTKTVLIQGPPGTGKSHTLVGIVKSLIANRPPPSSTGHSSILICAPTNCAIDEIGRRFLIHEATFMADFKLRLVRLGRPKKIHPDVLPYHMDRLVESTRTSARDLVQRVDLILSTLDSCQQPALVDIYRWAKKAQIRAVIVDEASQCVEPALLMPLVFPCRKLILIGDHLQLPAITPSRMAQSALYDRSLLERLALYFKTLQGDIPMYTLAIQYRMHPTIADFPSEQFYRGRLETPPGTGSHPALSSLQPLTVFNVTDSRLVPSLRFPSSRMNPAEAELIHSLVLSILAATNYRLDSARPPPFTIGIITFYNGQKAELMRRFGHRLARLVDINSVDSFQGQERDIVILSCVRAYSADAHWSEGVGFVRSAQRMNVALTRAKSALFVCLSESVFSGVPHWQQLMDKARARGRLITTPSTVSQPKLKTMISI